MNTPYQNVIVKIGSKYIIVNGNAESVQRYSSYDDALAATLADEIAFGPQVSHEDASKKSPITWK